MALQHLRSSTANKRPTPGAMSDGQLALNTNLVSPGLFFKDSNGDSVKIGPIHCGATAPNVSPGAGGQAGNILGEAWLDTSAANPILKVFNGSAFVAVQPVGTGTVVSTTDTGTVTSTMILDGTIVNADINAAAAIAGTKISPDFGSQTIATTGIVSHALGTQGAPTITFTGDTNTGIFSSGADQVAISTNSVERLKIGNSEVVFNDAGNDIDFRVEGDTNANLLFLDASTDRIGINQSAPATKLDLSGSYSQNIVAVAALDIDCSAGNYFTKTINANSTCTVSNVPASRAYAFTLELTHTSGTVTWFSGVEWPSGTAPTLTTGKTHLFMFVTDDGGTRWRASSLINYTN